MNFALSLTLVLFFMIPLHGSEKTRDERLKEDTETSLELGRRIASQFYFLEDNESIKEITNDVLNSNNTEDSIKEVILNTGRRFFLFKYPSDDFQVKGTISFVSNPSKNPLLLLLRGGNGVFGLTYPATDLTCMRNYTVIATTYRGGVSEGIDEFGGSEVNDVNNLMRYFPALQENLGISFTPNSVFMVGRSRGGMEMFLALARTPELQRQIKKVVSLSGLLDLHECIRDREDMRQMFVREFGLIPFENENEWIKRRNPIDAVSSIRKDLPILILQGTDDIRVGLDEGYNMVKKLEENGNPVTYLEVPGGDHCLKNQPNRVDLIADWFENSRN